MVQSQTTSHGFPKDSKSALASLGSLPNSQMQS